MKSPPLVRWLQLVDLPDVVAVEAVTAAEGFAWKERDFMDFLKETTTAGFVAETGRQLLGFVAFRTDLQTATARIVKLAVHPQHRRQGVGKASAAACWTKS
jgi:ribosomal protein S18 acetylase RimI-like enzyme